MRKNSFLFLIVIFAVILSSCNNPSADKPKSNIHFTSLSSGKTGITFNNTITENDSVNLIENEYTYMGGGVAIGDFNNDNLPDVFFGANQKSSKLYINKGNFTFEDITDKAGISTNSWTTGISVVDINNDGFDDIYVCASGSKNG